MTTGDCRSIRSVVASLKRNMKYCRNCGKANKDKVVFCRFCGTEFSDGKSAALNEPVISSGTSSGYSTCPECGGTNPELATLCSLCGCIFVQGSLRGAGAGSVSTQSVMQTITCPHCGSLFYEEWIKFCPECGVDISLDISAASMAPANRGQGVDSEAPVTASTEKVVTEPEQASDKAVRETETGSPRVKPAEVVEERPMPPPPEQEPVVEEEPEPDIMRRAQETEEGPTQHPRARETTVERKTEVPPPKIKPGVVRRPEPVSAQKAPLVEKEAPGPRKELEAERRTPASKEETVDAGTASLCPTCGAVNREGAKFCRKCCYSMEKSG